MNNVLLLKLVAHVPHSFVAKQAVSLTVKFLECHVVPRCTTLYHALVCGHAVESARQDNHTVRTLAVRTRVHCVCCLSSDVATGHTDMLGWLSTTPTKTSARTHPATARLAST